MTIEPKSAFKMRTILGPQSGVSYSALLGGAAVWPIRREKTHHSSASYQLVVTAHLLIVALLPVTISGHSIVAPEYA
jgi:hypothetical protein